MNFGEFSYKLVHNIAKKYSYFFKGIKEDLQISNLPHSLEEYFAMMIVSILFSTPLIGVIAFFFYTLIDDLVLSIISGFVFYSIVLVGIIALFYVYPSQVASGRKKKIDNSLHFAAIYMQTLAGTGAPPHILFRILGSFEEFSEIADISRKISRDIEMFGLDPVEAINRAAEKTPSSNLRELLLGMRSTITSGGDLKKYLEEKANAFVNEFRRKLEEFTKLLAVYMEIYITMVIVGSVLALVLTTIMSIISGGIVGIETLQILIVTVGLPMMSGIFILLIKSSSPTEV